MKNCIIKYTTGNLSRWLLIAAGTVFLALGVVGILLPLLPTTPFLLLAAACYAKSSKRFSNWLLNNRVFGKIIKDYREGWGIPLNSHAGGWDAFVAKLNNNGETVWHTFMGASNFDAGDHIFVDAVGHIYVAGTSDHSWGSPKNTHSGNEDAFILKMNNNGVWIWNTFMGSAQADVGHDCLQLVRTVLRTVQPDQQGIGVVALVMQRYKKTRLSFSDSPLARKRVGKRRR